MIGVSLLTAGFVCGGFVTHPSEAFASATAGAGAPAVAYSVTFDNANATSQYTTEAATVGDFLRERNIVVGPDDYIDPAADTPISDGLVVSYRPAVAVTIAVAGKRMTVLSSASDIGALLEESNVRLGPGDEVQPALADPVPTGGIVRVVHVLTWQRTEKRTIVYKTLARLDFSMTP
ncbi:MAG: DUF348 domain-containing protein, partial [Candidatus Eremiobacteraeota bacterium]|nr:DUF348 domain-containing protein [Candidatus Eremiobacteraeota bacterium]